MEVHVNQIRAARGLLGWSQKELAKRSGISDVSIINYEKGKRSPHQNTMDKIIRAFELGGVDFTHDGGVRPRKSRVVFYDGFDDESGFFEDIISSVKSSEDAEIRVAGADDLFCSSLYKEIDDSQVTCQVRVISSFLENVTGASIDAEWRVTEKENLAGTSFCLYDGKSAFIDISAKKITVVEDPMVAANLEKIFDRLWALSGV